MNAEWTYWETEKLRQLYPTRGAEAVAAMLGRSVRAVWCRAAKLGIKKHHYGYEWTAQRLKLLRDFYPMMFNDALARWIGVSKHALVRKARELGLEKMPGFIEARRHDISAKMSDALKRSTNTRTRFKPGQHGSPGTEFKPGHRLTPEQEAKRIASLKAGNARRRAQAELKHYGIGVSK